MNLLDLSYPLDIAIEAAHLSGDILRHYYGSPLHIRDKNFQGDLVTEADFSSEKALIDFLQKHFPDYGFLGEESGRIPSKSPWQWIVDPLDGTTNFSHKHPVFCVSIALAYLGEPKVGVVYNPVHQELFHAREGSGAFLNGKRIHVSLVDSLEKSLLASGFPYDRRETSDNNYREFCHLTELTQGVRRLGSAALDLAYTAAGFIDGYWERGIKPWDIAAGIVLVKEAGGKVTRYDGTPREKLEEERLLVTNGHIHDLLKDQLQMIKQERD